MVYRLQGVGLGKTEKKIEQAQKADDVRAARAATAAARDEWKMYVASLQNLDKNLRKGTLPPQQGLPQPPSSPADLAPDLFKQAKQILEGKLPAAYQIARNLDLAKGQVDARSSYAAGQPAVSPAGTFEQTYIPAGNLPGPVQQAITDAYGASPVLTQAPPEGLMQTDQGQAIGDGSSEMVAGRGGGAGGGMVKKLAIAAAVGVALWLAYRWWKKRK